MEFLNPTKANFIKSKAMLDFSQKGYILLDKKRNVLVKEIMSRIDEVESIQKEIDTIFQEAYTSLEYSGVTMGVSHLEEIALSVPKNEEISVLFKSVMGVELPVVENRTQGIQPYYGFFRTNAALDQTVTKMNQVKILIYRLAEIENAIFRLAMEIKKTSKRANALEKIQIPYYREMTKKIGEVLEEKEREDFFRLKRFAAKKENG
ncbi:MAG: V-type ATP synthase subunit D [Tissierellales bacterium]|nr:V-type ATP synthase subunit D [Tissierellales bacterium]MBN2827941.1 V-type ATP synthase subunit D [Tissierellales bacterium]